MSRPFQPSLDFEAAERAADEGGGLVLELDGFEGPLHLLLALARSQKVDLLKISVARLAEQYLAFVETQRRLRFGLAAEYLVMASWLAYLKSRLLLPKPEAKGGDEPPVEELAEALAFRLAKLAAMREAAEALKARPRWGVDIFGRGGEAALAAAETRAEEDLYGLMTAYASARMRQAPPQYRPAPRVEAYGLEAARERLRGWLPRLQDWTPLARIAPCPHAGEGPSRASYVASTFSAGLEMTKEGALELRQQAAFEPLFLRAARDAG